MDDTNNNKRSPTKLRNNDMKPGEQDQLMPLMLRPSQNGKPMSADDSQIKYPAPPPYETIPRKEEEKIVTFSRSQSLPQLSSEHISGRRGDIERIRFFSGRVSIATLGRMRQISTRTFSVVAPTDENQTRGNWSNPIEFFLSCLGYAVGLGNVWRFPYLCYQSGGGAFLIPYLLMLFGCGLPLMLMELALGQYSSQGPLTVWKFAPLFKGIGIGMVLCSCMVAIYYNMITGWSLYYLVISIRDMVPWACCEGSWASPDCVSFLTNSSFCPPQENRQGINLWENGSTAKFAADEYFHNHVLSISEGLHSLGQIQWPLVLALLAAWAIVFAVLMKGIKSFGKAVYFTSTFPYLILLVLLIRSVMEEGAMDGIKFYLTPKWEKLKEAKVWGDAASQIFYSTGVCFGGGITLASYNRFRNNVYRDAIIVALGNSLTSIFSGFVVFSILGFMAHNQNTTVDKVVTGGPGLTFIAYPQAVTLLPWSPFWSILFFTMLVTLALSTMFPTIENIATSIIDQFTYLRQYKFFVMFLVCLLGFLLGLPLTTEGGMYILQLMDNYGVGYALLFLGLMEVTVVAWGYGADRLVKNIQAMVGNRPLLFLWKYIWVALSPSLLIFSVIFTIVEFRSLEYDKYKFPPWANSLGLCLTAVSLVPIPGYIIYKLLQYFHRQQLRPTLDNLLMSLRVLTTPDPEWGPALPQYRFAGADYGDDDVFS